MDISPSGSRSTGFNRPSGAAAGAPVFTGEALWIEIKYAAINRSLLARGLNDWTVAWSDGKVSTWSLWIAGNSSSGVAISLGDQIVIRCEDQAYQGNHLTQYRPDNSRYLTDANNSNPRTFQVQSDDAARGDDDQGDRTAALPPIPGTRNARTPASPAVQSAPGGSHANVDGHRVW